MTPNERAIPEAAFRDPRAFELLRVWVAEQSLWCSLTVGTYRNRNIPEEKAWGVILADAARHVADALRKSENVEGRAALAAIRASFNAELDHPTSPVAGRFLDQN